MGAASIIVGDRWRGVTPIAIVAVKASSDIACLVKHVPSYVQSRGLVWFDVGRLDWGNRLGNANNAERTDVLVQNLGQSLRGSPGAIA